MAASVERQPNASPARPATVLRLGTHHDHCPDPNFLSVNSIFLDGWHRFGRYSGIITRKSLSALRYEVRVILMIVCGMPLFADCSFENVFQESNLGGTIVQDIHKILDELSQEEVSGGGGQAFESRISDTIDGRPGKVGVGRMQLVSVLLPLGPCLNGGFWEVSLVICEALDVISGGSSFGKHSQHRATNRYYSDRAVFVHTSGWNITVPQIEQNTL